MKKIWIPALLFTLAITNFGCSKKPQNAPPAAVAGQIMPPMATSDPIKVTTQDGQKPAKVTFNGTFTVMPPASGDSAVIQTVTIVGPKGDTLNVYTSAKTTWTDTTAEPSNGNYIFVYATTNGKPYAKVMNVPPANPNNTGNLISTYSDVSGNASQITVQAE